MKRITLLTILLMPLLALLAGDGNKGIRTGQPYVQVLYGQGVHWNRTENLQEQMEGGYRSVEARFGFQTTGKKDWHQLCRFPRYGWGLHYADQVIGVPDSAISNPISVFAFYHAPIARFGKFSINTHTSVGLSYMKLIYDPETNPFNDLVGSHVNLFFDFNLNLVYQVSPRLDLHASYGVNHYSNGNIHEPQKGLNNWGGKAGLSYHFGGKDEPFKRTEFTTRELEEFTSHEEVQLMFAVGVVERQGNKEEYGTHYFTSSFTADYAVQFRRRSAFTTGLDILYDDSLERSIKGYAPSEVKAHQKVYLGGHIGYQLSIDRLILLYNVGVYFHHYSYGNSFYFHRAGARYLLTDHLAAHLCLKARNGIRSDWIEWGVAYSIHTR